MTTVCSPLAPGSIAAPLHAPTAPCAAAPAPAARGPGARLRAAWSWLVGAPSTPAALEQLDAHTLRDIGLSEGVVQDAEARREARIARLLARHGGAF